MISTNIGGLSPKDKTYYVKDEHAGLVKKVELKNSLDLSQFDKEEKMKFLTRFLIRTLINGIVIALLEVFYYFFVIGSINFHANFFSVLILPAVITAVLVLVINFAIEKCNILHISKGYRYLAMIAATIIVIGVWYLRIRSIKGQGLDFDYVEIYSFFISIALLGVFVLVVFIRMCIKWYRKITNH